MGKWEGHYQIIADFLLKWGPYEPPCLDIGGYDGPFEEIFPKPYHILDHTYDGEIRTGVFTINGWVVNGELQGLKPHLTFNTIVSTESMEHWDDPIRAFDNIALRCNSGAKIVITTPSAWGYHASPKDCWRVQKDGWEYMCKRTGIRIVEYLEQRVGDNATVGMFYGIKP